MGNSSGKNMTRVDHGGAFAPHVPPSSQGRRTPTGAPSTQRVEGKDVMISYSHSDQTVMRKIKCEFNV